MEEEKGGTGTSLKISQPLLSADPSIASPLLPQPAHALVPAPAPAKNPPKEAEVAGQRQMFTVELRRGETTIVSWKKLLRESGSGNGEASSFITRNQLPDTRPVAGVHPKEDDLKHTIQPQNCFSAVIEKIERLYMGRESSDEEELDAPDDDQYDTEDSFIDDTELDEYFQVDKLSTKHNGYFVNRGKLEWVEPSSSPNLAPKKRKRKESTKEPNETDHERVLNEHVSMGIMKIKAAARNAPLVAKKLSPTEAMPSYEEQYQEGKLLKAKPNSSTTIYRKRPADSAIKLDISPPTRLQNNEHSSVLIESKETNKRKFFSPKSLHKYSTATESFGTTIQVSREKAGGSQVEQLSKKVFNANKEIEVSAKMQRKEKHVFGDYPQNSSMAPYPTQALKHPFPHLVREGTLRPKGTTMERAIRDLEKIVELCRPLDPGVQEVDPSAQGIKRRLPQEVKQKLAKVARLSASQSKISEEELINRLMGFLGHLVQRKTLKRNMREMVELGLSAKQQKADKLLQIKKEVLEMIKARVSLLKVPEQQDALTDDFQDVVNTDERRALRGRYCMDAALEDKICDLYDLHVEGMDEDKGPQSRKLYVELAELWPAGYMDNFGIKDAIYRAKKRRRHKLQSRGEERIIERKNTATAAAAVKPEEAPAPEKQIPSLNPLLQSRILDRGNGGGIRASPAADAAKKRAAKMAKEKLIHRSGDESAPARPPPPRAAEIPAAAPPPFDQPS